MRQYMTVFMVVREYWLGDIFTFYSCSTWQPRSHVIRNIAVACIAAYIIIRMTACTHAVACTAGTRDRQVNSETHIRMSAPGD